MKFHSDDIRKYRTLLENLLSEGDDTNISQTELNNLFKEINTLLPTFLVSEKTGKEGEDRDKFKDLFSSFSRGSTDVETRITNIVNKLNNVDNSVSDLSTAIQNLIFLKTINTMLSSFNAQTIGFMMEALLAAIFNGAQISINKSTGETISKDNIIDVIIGDEAWSIKTLKGDNEQIEGSINLLAVALNDNKAKNIVYYLYISKNEKTTEPDKLSFYKFLIDGNNETHIKALAKHFNLIKINDIFQLKSKPKVVKSTTLPMKNSITEVHNDAETHFSYSLKQFSEHFVFKKASFATLKLKSTKDDNIAKMYEKYLKDIKNNLIPIYETLNEFNASLILYFRKKGTAKNLQDKSNKVPKTTATSIEKLKDINKTT